MFNSDKRFIVATKDNDTLVYINIGKHDMIYIYTSDNKMFFTSTDITSEYEIKKLYNKIAKDMKKKVIDEDNPKPPVLCYQPLIDFHREYLIIPKEGYHQYNTYVGDLDETLSYFNNSSNMSRLTLHTIMECQALYYTDHSLIKDDLEYIKI